MAGETQELLTIMRIQTDQSSFEKAQAVADQLQKQYDRIKQEVLKTTEAIQQYNAATSQGAGRQGVASLQALESQLKSLKTQQASALTQMQEFNRAVLASSGNERLLGQAVNQYTVTLQKQSDAKLQNAQATRELRRQETGWLDTLQKGQQVAGPSAAPVSFGRMGRATTGLGRGLSLLGPSVMPITGAGASTFRAVYGIQVLSDTVPKLGAQALASAGSVTAMTASLGAGALAIAAMVVAWNQFKKIIDASKGAVQDYMATQQRYAEVIATGTTEDVQKAIKANEDRNKALEIERAALQNLVDTAENTSGFAGALLDVNDALGLNLGGIEDAKKRLKEVNGEITTNVSVNAKLEQGLANGATAAADLAAQLEDAQKKFEAFSASTVQRIQTGASIRGQATQEALTADDPRKVQEAIAGFRIELQQSEETVKGLTVAYQNGLLTENDYLAALKKEADTQGQLQEKIDLWNTQVLAAAEAREREIAAIEHQKTVQATMVALRERESATAFANLAGATNAGKQFQEDAAKAMADRAQELAYEQADFERKRAKDIAAHYADLADIDAQYYDKVAEQTEKLGDIASDSDKAQLKEAAEFAKDSQRQAEDHSKAMRRIERDLNASVEGAIEDRNIGAVIEAARSAKEKAQDEQDQYEEEKKRRDEDFKDRLDELKDQRNEKLAAGRKALDDLRKQHDKEHAANINAFNQRIREEDTERRIAHDRQATAWANEDAARLTHFQNQLSNYGFYWNQVETITHGGMANVTQAITDAWNDIRTRLQVPPGGGIANIPGGNPPPGQYWPTAYQGGGRPPLDRWVVTSEGGAELARFGRDGGWQIYSNRQARQLVTGPLIGSLTIPITTTGSPEEIERVVIQRVVPQMTRAIQQVQGGRAL